MTRRILACALVLAAVLAWPTPGYAQEATLVGTVTDANWSRTSRRHGHGRAREFNVFNHENFGSYVTMESSGSFERASANANIAYAPRTLQLGFRATF